MCRVIWSFEGEGPKFIFDDLMNKLIGKEDDFLLHGDFVWADNEYVIFAWEIMHVSGKSERDRVSTLSIQD